MKNSKSTPVNLVAIAGAAEIQLSVRQRIEQRLKVLREWHREGIPAGQSIPSSLTAARLWQDTELGIHPISSPNEFTTTHRLYGSLVTNVSGLLTELKKRYGRPDAKSPRGQNSPSNKFDRAEFDSLLEAAVSQWHSERDRRLHEEHRADASDARSIDLLEENTHKDALIADLRRQLAARAVLRSVE